MLCMLMHETSSWVFLYMLYMLIAFSCWTRLEIWKATRTIQEEPIQSVSTYER